MAEKDKNNLIGYDPLAWMKEESADSGDINKESDAEDNANTEIEAIVDEEVAEKFETGLEKENNEPENDSDFASIDNQDDSKIVLEARHSIQNVSDLYSQMKVLLENNNKIEIDASAVSVIDASTLQLLIILKQTATKLDKQIIIDFPSDPFIEAAELLGLSEMLEVDHAAAGLF